jgi:hypothetical protein
MQLLFRHVASSVPLATMAVVWLAIAPAARATPQLPVIPANVFSILDYGGSTASADNSTAILNAIGAAHSAGGGTVLIPSGTFAANPFTITTGTINLQIDGTLQAPTMSGFGAAANYITWSSVTNVRMSGAGTIDGQGADWWSHPPIPAASRPRLVRFNSSQTVEVTGLTTINSPSFFFALSGSAANYTFNNLTITAPADSPNTDGIDVAGSNILITNCTIAVGDDNIAVKAGSQFSSDITISHNTFGSGHGVSVGGGSAFGLSSMLVTSCTFNGTTNGLRLKAQDAPGGNAGGGLAHPVTGVTYDGITMTNVAHPIVIDSFYNGGNNFPSSPTDPTHYPSVAAPVSTTTPMWENISFANITATGGADAGRIYGLNTVPNNIQGLSFDNVHISAAFHMNLWYASDVDLSGLTISVPPGDAYANATPVSGAYLYAVTVPEPSTEAVGLAALAFIGSWLLRRRRAATPGRPPDSSSLAVVIGLRGS